ncbi:MAG: acetate--CoA ligase family protein [Elusimicrobia bacterium]|nr:acetate--CoA ligase family protein [Elusimicrobiota bacterium]
MTSGSLDTLFNPKSIAVIGASRRAEAVGHAVFKNLHRGGYKGALYPVNPKSPDVLGVKCFASISEIPGPVDLAVLIVPATAAVPTFEECLRKGVKSAVVISAGFREVGPDGAALEKQLADMAVRSGVSFVGPNCLGIINPDPAVLMNASFAQCTPMEGNIAFVSQSGALCTAVLEYAKGINVGFSKFISLGNKANVTELELLEYLGRDEKTDVILMYVEDVMRPQEMIRLCRKITGENAKRKPILAIKSGRTIQGAKAASSHTGSLAGSEEIYDAIFAQSGIMRVDTVGELFDCAVAFGSKKFPKSNRIAIVTNAGGPGIMATDAAVRFGLEIAPLEAGTVAELKKHLPASAAFGNPVDVIGDAQHGRYEAALKGVSKDPNVDSLLVILTPQAMTDTDEIARVIGETGSETDKPILACFMGMVEGEGLKVLSQKRIPHYVFPESAAKALSRMSQFMGWVQRPRTEVKTFPANHAPVRKMIETASRENRNLTDLETFEALRHYGFPVLPVELCAGPAEAGRAAEHMGYPVVLKINSPDVLHKFDVGGVRLNIGSRAEAEKAAEAILSSVRERVPSARVLGVTVQKMAKKGREVILGLKRDPHFGPLMMFGLGGTYVEVLKDVTFRLAPIRELGAQEMVRNIRAFKILEGVRGEAQADLEKIEECLMRLSQLAQECPEIEELDINPLVTYNKGEGCAVVDARILLSKPGVPSQKAEPAAV